MASIPSLDAGERRYVTYRIRRGLTEMALLDPIPHYCQWETRMYDRVLRLYDPANPSATSTDEWLEAGLGAITLGNELLRLRHWLESEMLSDELRNASQNVIFAFGRFLSEPQEAAAEVKRRINQVAPLDPGPSNPQRRGWARLLGAFEEIDIYLGRHTRLLNAKDIASG